MPGSWRFKGIVSGKVTTRHIYCTSGHFVLAVFAEGNSTEAVKIIHTLQSCVNIFTVYCSMRSIVAISSSAKSLIRPNKDSNLKNIIRQKE
jgi:hypothetical protein